MRVIISIFLCAPALLWAGEFQLLQDDVALSREEVVEVTAGEVLTFYDGGRSKYSVGGAYSYTYDQGSTAFGSFTVGADGLVCIAYRNGRSRCDRFVHSHGRLVMLTANGDRFAVRP